MSENAKQELLQLMETISKDGYHAKWMSDLEHSLWNAILNGPIIYGQTKIDQPIIMRLQSLSSQANGWWMWDHREQTIKFVTLSIWEKSFLPERATPNSVRLH